MTKTNAMTNAEAIETLKANYPDACFEQLREAVDKAIKALEDEEIIKSTSIINAYKIVLEDMKKCDLLCGKYDAKNGNEHFMYGVALVMEWIATRAEDEEFCKKFDENLIGSELRK